MSNLVLYEKLMEQDALQAVEKLGKYFASSGLFGIDKEAQGQVMAMTCLADGITPVDFSRTYHIVEGKLSMKADAMLARYMELGGKVVWLESTDKVCRGRWVYGQNDIEVSFSIEDAYRAGLCGPDGTRKESVNSKGEKQAKDGNWQKYPDAMLRARCSSKAIRMLCPLVNAGIHCQEERDDVDDASPTPLPRRGRSRSSASHASATEPIREADATVVDETPPETTNKTAADLDLSSIANEANAYLLHLKWIQPGGTWHDLNPDQCVKMTSALSSFTEKATEHYQEMTNDNDRA